jgi:hypothetical protein
MEDLRQILVLDGGFDTSLQRTLLVADDTAGASLQPTTTSNTRAPLRCARRSHCTLQLLQLGTIGRD